MRANYFEGFTVVSAGTELLCPICHKAQARLNVDLDLTGQSTFDVRAISQYDPDHPFGISCCEERYIDFDGRIYTNMGWI